MLKLVSLFGIVVIPSAAFRRLCVETADPMMRKIEALQPPSGGCVLKQLDHFAVGKVVDSRLQAAVC